MTPTRKISIVAVVTGLFVALAVYSWQHKYDPRTYGYNFYAGGTVQGVYTPGEKPSLQHAKHHMTQQERVAAYVYLFTDNGRF